MAEFSGEYDGYLTKPVEIKVLVATLQRVVRGVPEATGFTSVKRAYCSMNPGGGRLIEPGGKANIFTKSERKFVTCLLDRRNEVVPRDILVPALTEDVYGFDLHRLDNLLHRLRRKVELVTEEGFPITSVHGEGYVWSPRGNRKKR